MSEPPTAPDRQPPRLAWLRILGASLLGIAGIFLLVALRASPVFGTNAVSHTKWVIMFAAIGICGPASGLVFWVWYRLAGRYDATRPFKQQNHFLFGRNIGRDPSEPDKPFVDGKYAYQIQELPARCPVMYTRDAVIPTGSNLLQVLYANIAILVSKRLDRRVKVVVSRRLVAASHLWHVLAVEFFNDSAAAQRRVAEIATTWDPTAFAALEPLTRGQLRSMLQSSSSADSG